MAKDDPVGALLGMVLQHCTVETVIQSERTPNSWYYVMHSGHISANADAMRVLGAFGKIKITHDGRGTRWVEGVCRMEADDAE